MSETPEKKPKRLETAGKKPQRLSQRSRNRANVPTRKAMSSEVQPVIEGPPYEIVYNGSPEYLLERLRRILRRDIVSANSLKEDVHLERDLAKLSKTITTGESNDRVYAARLLDELAVPTRNLSALFEGLISQEPFVRLLVVRSANRSVQRASPSEALQISKEIGPVVLNLLLQDDRWLRQEAASLVNHFAKVDPRFHSLLESLAEYAPHNAVPKTTERIDQLIVAASRSQEALAELIRRAALQEGNGGFSVLEIDPIAMLDSLAKKKCEIPIQGLFDQLEGLSFGSIRKNQEASKIINAALRAVNNKVMCKMCSQCASIQCLPDKRTQSGLFYFDHGKKAESRFHGGTGVLPRLLAIPNLPETPRKHG